MASLELVVNIFQRSEVLGCRMEQDNTEVFTCYGTHSHHSDRPRKGKLMFVSSKQRSIECGRKNNKSGQ